MTPRESDMTVLKIAVPTTVAAMIVVDHSFKHEYSAGALLQSLCLSVSYSRDVE